MSILNDRRLLELCEAGMLTPFDRTTVRKLPSDVPCISHGVGPFGYDVKLHPHVRLQVKADNYLGGAVSRSGQDVGVGAPHRSLIDPKRPETMDRLFVDAVIRKDQDGSEFFVLDANGFALGKCLPKFNLPRNVSAICMSKSTYARAGICVETTPIQAGHQGDVVLEIHNKGNHPCKIYINEGIAFFMFFEGDEPDLDYSQTQGVYHGQEGIKLPTV